VCSVIDPGLAAWARELGVSHEAVDLYVASDVIDLHIDSFIWSRLAGYDLTRRHTLGPLGGRFFRQVDFPRIREARVTGATWVITTNIGRRSPWRGRTFFRNLEALVATFARAESDFAVVRTAAEYRAARALGKHGAFIGVQGGNAFDENLAWVDAIPDGLVLRVTLVHLLTSSLGGTSSPLRLGSSAGLSTTGRALVERLNARKIFVDLAHVSREGFFDALEVHDKTQPVLVTHTGVSGVHPHWRNLDDEQLRAVARTGGTVGIMYQAGFLGPSHFGGRAAAVVDHLAHIVNVVGEDHASLGSDWDGMIVPPVDMPSCLELPKLVQIMLDRGFSPERVQKILGGNFLRVVAALRG
jgi:membrane dipeptidase